MYAKLILIYANSSIRIALLKLNTSNLAMTLCIRKYIEQIKKFFQLNYYYISYYWLQQIQIAAPMISCFLLKVKFSPSQIAVLTWKKCIFWNSVFPPSPPPKFIKIRPNKKLLLFWLTSFEIKVSCRKIKLWSWRYSQLDRVSRDFWCLKSASLPKFMKLTYSWQLAFLKNTLCSFSTQVSPRLAQDFWLS